MKKSGAFRSRAWRESARGQGCTLQIPGICNGDLQTVVLCHLASPMHGMGYKSDDFWAVYGCSACHDVLDGRAPYDWRPGEREEVMLAALYWTLRGRLGEV